MKHVLSLLVFLMVFSLVGCATGSAIVTGTARPATNVEEVKIYTEMPENCEVIGVVTATSDMGWNQQDSTNYAIAELKKQAAKIGANGVVIENINTTNTGFVFYSNINYGSTVTGQTVSGKAIYVAE